MRRVTWSEAATADLTEIRVYLSQYSPVLAQDTVDRIILSALDLITFPALGSPVGYRRWRRWRAKRTRYLLIYELTQDGIMIVRVRDDRSDWRPAPS